MKVLRVWASRAKGFVLREAYGQDIREEVEAHIQFQTAAYMGAGLNEEQARRAALVAMHGRESVMQAMREQRTIPILENALQDFHFTFRQHRRHPSFILIAMLIYGISVGAALSLFSFVDAALIRPLPYYAPQQLAMVTERTNDTPRAGLSWLDYQDWRQADHLFSAFAAWHSTSFLYKHADIVSPIRAATVSSNFFKTLGVHPLLGTDFDESANVSGAPHTALISHSSWVQYFGSNRNVIGQAARLGDESYSIIGVLPEDFHFAQTGVVDFWVALQPRASCELQRSCHDLEGVARLRPGTTLSDAKLEIQTLARRLQAQYPISNSGQDGTVLSLTEATVGEVRPLLLTLLCGSLLLLLVGIVNISSLILSRSESRRREFALRVAVGATPDRLLQQFITEAFLLVAFGSFLALAISQVGTRFLLHLIASDTRDRFPFLEHLGLQWHLVLGLILLACGAWVCFAVAASLRLPLKELRSGLTESTSGSGSITWRRLGVKLIVVELATAVVLLFCAGLVTKSLSRLSRIDVGFEVDHLVTLYLTAPAARYRNDLSTIALLDAVKQRANDLPGVELTGIVDLLPMSPEVNTEWVRIVGSPSDGRHNEVSARTIDESYLQTLRAHLHQGRLFSTTDKVNTPSVAIVNSRFAKLYFPNDNPIGKRIGDESLSTSSLGEIIGVIDDIHEGPPEVSVSPVLYRSIRQHPVPYFYLVARVQGDTNAILPSLIKAVHSIDSELATSEELPLSQRIYSSDSSYLHRSAAWLVGAFAILALCLSSVGLYGVISYSVGQRTREIAVRIALGARKERIYQMIVGEAVSLASVGLLIGIIVSFVAATSIRALLFGVNVWDIVNILLVVTILYASVFIASIIPAYRATAVDPNGALRAQ